MPDPLLYVQSLGVAALVSALVALAAAAGRDSHRWVNLVSLLALQIGMIAGLATLGWGWKWPPASALDRLVYLVIPAGLVAELIANFGAHRRRVGWSLRLAVVVFAPVALLFGSVYVTAGDESAGIIGARLAIAGFLLGGLWYSLSRLASQSAASLSIFAALCLALFATGMAILLGGYIKGGAVVFPLVGSLAATALALFLCARRDPAALIAMGSLELFGVVCVGHFFGRLSTAAALSLLLAPVLCWGTEIPALRRLLDRNGRRWTVGALRLALVAIPIVVVLIAAKRDFDQKMGTLLTDVPMRNR